MIILGLIEIALYHEIKAHHSHEPDDFREMKSLSVWAEQAELVFSVEDAGNLVRIPSAETEIGVVELGEEIIGKAFVAVPGDLVRTFDVADAMIGCTQKVKEFGTIGIALDQAIQRER